MIQLLKDRLVKLGPQNSAVQLALLVSARLHGFGVLFESGCITVHRGKRAIILDFDRYVQVPIIINTFDLYFRTIRPAIRDGVSVLDFSRPGLHTYLSSGAEFEFANIPEDDSMDAYLHLFHPKPGETVWDVGAHSGFTTYSLSKLVGPVGHVYAFEPDDLSYEYLRRNLQRHGLSNVTAVRKALSDETGYTDFNMDGTMSAGIPERLIYSGNGKLQKVEAISLADACHEFGNVPSYIKMDIEGSEVAAIRGSGEFLRRHPIHFAIEGHRTNAEHTCTTMTRLFMQLGYQVRSSGEFGAMFTWASPARN